MKRIRIPRYCSNRIRKDCGTVGPKSEPRRKEIKANRAGGVNLLRD